MTPALSIRALSKIYANGVHALHGIDLDVAQGDFFALLGPNGAGKSTIIGIIASLVNKSAGKVSVFGKDLDTQLYEAKQYLGLVPQEFNFNMFEPVEEIVINQAGYYGIDRHTATERAHRYLQQLDLWTKRRTIGRELSGGMKRRLMIARALVHSPRLLILDEPTAGVDIEIRRSMWEFLRELNHQGTTIILTTHYLEEAENLCRNIAIIDQGRIIQHTSMKSLLGRLNRETFILNLEAALKTVPEVPPYQLTKVDDTTLELDLSRDSNLNQVFKALSDSGINVQSMRNKSNRLEELFLCLIGKNGISDNMRREDGKP